MTQQCDAQGSARSARTIDRFYPIVPDADWIDRLVPLGVKMIQLRMKEVPAAQITRDIKRAIATCGTHDCLLVVNDYWEEAISLGAEFVHLGQEDLAGADLGKIKASGLGLGISTHDVRELDVALAAQPDYVALGPVYETKLKAMAWAPQGLERVGEWKRRIAPVPLVAIGGINIERAPGVLAAGADCVSVITDFVTHRDPEARVRAWVQWSQS